MIEVKKTPVIFVFGGGGARAAAIAGAAAVLFEEGIRPDYIIGSSMGFVVGGLLAAGLHPEEVCRYFECGKIMDAFIPLPPMARLVSLPLILVRHLMGCPPYDGFYSASKFRNYLNHAVAPDQQKIENWKIPVAAVAFNLISGKSELIEGGEFGLVSTATTAVPGLFRPVEIADGLFLDGGICENLPVARARVVANRMGGAMVIAINVNEPYEKQLDSRHFRKIGSTLCRVMSAHNKLTDDPQEDLAHVVIRVEVPCNLISRNKRDIKSAIASGITAARGALPKIRACTLEMIQVS